jgi:5-methylcytosine-specific restriction endonuclease McrA
MIRKSKHEISDVLSTYEIVMDDEDAYHYTTIRETFHGDEIKFSSHRLWTFFETGITCVNCGIEGEFFAKEKNGEHEESFHLNLYGIDGGKEVLMTKDHITPKSEGGNDHISNYQTMCKPCNEKKGRG